MEMRTPRVKSSPDAGRTVERGKALRDQTAGPQAVAGECLERATRGARFDDDDADGCEARKQQARDASWAGLLRLRRDLAADILTQCVRPTILWLPRALTQGVCGAWQ